MRASGHTHMINATLNKKILALWAKYFAGDKNVYAPIFYDNLKQGGIVFVGMNPSFNPKKLKSTLKRTPYAHIDPASFYRWSNVEKNPDLVDEELAIGKHIIGEYSFFKKMHEMAEDSHTHFQHLDLFLYRQTQQNEFMRLVQDKKKVLNEFGGAQLRIFEEALAQINPQIIVVSNAGASDILRERFKDRLSFDENRGFHLLSLGESRVPIFFSSMLSGQRALDKGSYERLRWHVRQST